MTTSIKVKDATARTVAVLDDMLIVDLADGRSIRTPLSWFPRLSHASQAELSNYRFIGGGEGIHWPDLDEDLSVAGLLEGRRSGESQESLREWLKQRG